MSSLSLNEKVRPTRYEDVVGQEEAVKMLRRVGAGGKSFLFAGASGTGKTTLARILASTIAESWHIEEVDAQDCTVDMLREMEVSFHYSGMGEKRGKAWIINECHGMRAAIVSRFLTLVEALPDHCTVIFTTTRTPKVSLFAEMDDADPFLSRCKVVPMASVKEYGEVGGPFIRKIAAAALKIARAEGLDGQPLEAYERLAKKHDGNYRRVISEIESGVMLRE